MAWRIEVNKRQYELYEKGVDVKIIAQIDFNNLFDEMLSILKGKNTVKTVAEGIRKQLNLSKKDFDSVYYGQFPPWLHDYVLEQWSQYVGSTLDKELLTIILRLDIDEWETYFCNAASLETLLTSMRNIRATYHHLVKWDLHIKGLEDKVRYLKIYNNILKNEALN